MDGTHRVGMPGFRQLCASIISVKVDKWLDDETSKMGGRHTGSVQDGKRYIPMR